MVYLRLFVCLACGKTFFERKREMTCKAKVPDYTDTNKEALISSFSSFISSNSRYSVYNSSEYTLLPGFCDVHVHFRQPGFVYKETIATGSAAAARGGYTAVCTMPNLNPVPDSLENLKIQTNIIDRDALIDVIPYGAITVGEGGGALADMAALAPHVAAFSDDGRGVQSADMMRRAMECAKSLDKIIAAHCEDNSLLRGGYIHDGEYAAAHGHRGICSESEYGQIARDLELAAAVGCKYHVCHISTAESVEIIRQAKKSGVDVTCETAPHYLVMCDEDMREDGRFKMNPPLRARRDMEALLEGVADGTVDMIATDHAPHSAEEKSRGLKGSPFGIVGLETAFPVLHTHLVKKNIITLEKLVDLMSSAPRQRFGIEPNGFSLWKLGEEYEICPDSFLSMGRATPFAGWRVCGKNYLTVSHGKTVYEEVHI